MDSIRPLGSTGASGIPDTAVIPNAGGTLGASGIIDTSGTSGTGSNAIGSSLNAGIPRPNIEIPDLKSPDSIINPTIPGSSFKPLGSGLDAVIPHPGITISDSNLKVSEPGASGSGLSLEAAGLDWDTWANLS